MSSMLKVVNGETMGKKIPLIGVTSARIMNEGSFNTGMPKSMVNSDYTDAITKVNGLPIIIPPVCNDMEIERYAEMCDGLLVSGGKDVAPLLYGCMSDKNCGAFDYDVDESHIKLIKAVLKYNKPIFGICRGLQLINVALGGTLHQDIGTNVPNCGGHTFGFFRYDVVHKVDMNQNTLIGKIFKKDVINVNSIHHQAIKDLGNGIEIAGVAPDGIIEAISSEEHNMIAVQWHPEMLLNKNDDMKCLFEVFVQACKG